MCADTAFISDSSLAALLDWYAAVGVDLAVDDAPHDRFAESARPPSEAKAPPPRRAEAAPAPTRSAAVAATPPAFPDEAARAAREAAANASSVDELRRSLEAFDGCAFKATAGHFLFSSGAPGARLMVLDFSPGEEEERSGEAFVGPEARLLDNMLAAIGLARESAYLAYATPWRPPGGRELYAHEAAALLPFLQRHIELAAPDILLVLGDHAARAAFGPCDVARLRGAWTDYVCGARRPRAMVSLGLSILLKSPALKRRAWRDLRGVAKAVT